METKKKVVLITTIGMIATMLMTSVAFATAPELKLPYPGGETWLITQAYDGITHQGLDYYAIDFTLNGCDAYDRPVLAVASGTIIEVDSGHVHGEPNSYGNKVVIQHEDGYTSLYGHLDQILVQEDQEVAQGRKIGTVGNTGYCLGGACEEYPGTHLHFRMIDEDGEAYKPEPMSGYTNFETGQWCLSDNYGDSWNFNTPNNAEGWTAVNAEDYSVEDGKYFINPEENDPYIQGAALSLSSDDYNAIEINMASNCPDKNMRIYFTTTDSSDYSEDKRVSFEVNNDGDWHTYIVYMAGNLWKGATITGIRIDPADMGEEGTTDTDTVGFDWIKAVQVEHPRYDINEDGVVNVLDTTAWRQAYYYYIYYDIIICERCDCSNGNGYPDASDWALLASHFGEQIPTV